MTDDSQPAGVAIVTGGSQGIGLATVKAFAGRGMRVAAFGRDRGRLDEAVASSGGGPGVVGIHVDVRDEASVARAVEQVVDAFGRVDVLVNSAGLSMSARRRLVDSTLGEWTRLIDTNLTGTYLMCREVLPLLERDGGYVLNVLSTAAHRATAGVSLYAASKYGARALTEALVEEYEGTRVRFTSVSPGPVDTTIWEHKINPPSTEERAQMMRPSDIADIFTWLLDRPARLHIKDITVTPWEPSNGASHARQGDK